MPGDIRIQTVRHINLGFLIFFIYLFAVSLALVLRELKINATRHYAFSSLRNSSNLLKEYINLQLVHKLLMLSSGYIFLVLHLAAGHMILFCNYTVLANWNTANSTPSFSIPLGLHA